MNTISSHVNIPKLLHHGTVLEYYEDIKDCVAKGSFDRSVWRPRCDFGAGFYMTSNIQQAKEWAIKKEESDPGSVACVITFEIDNHMSIAQENENELFTAVDLEWAAYIMEHRLRTTKRSDPCGENHAGLVIGSMADNKISDVVETMRQDASLQDPKWFLEQITQRSYGKRLSFYELGNQFAFCDTSMARYLRIVGKKCTFRGRWRDAEDL